MTAGKRVLFPRLPTTNESLEQHLHRVRQACSYETARWWRDLVPPNAGPANLLHADQHMAALAAAIGRSPSEVAEMTVHRFAPAYRAAEGTPASRWNSTDLLVYTLGSSREIVGRVCPLCRAGRQTVLLPWSLRQVTTCPTHLVRLVDHCSNCNRPLQMNVKSGCCVSCGYNAARYASDTIATDPDAVAMTIAVWTALNCLPESFPPVGLVDANHPLARMAPHALLLYLWECALLLERRDPTHPFFDNGRRNSSVLFRTRDVNDWHVLMLQAWRLLGSWPGEFNAALARIAAHEESTHQPQCHFPRFLFRRLADPSFAWLHDAWESFMYDALDVRPSTLRWYPFYREFHDRTGSTRPSLISKSDTASRLGTVAQTLHRFVAEGRLTPRVVPAVVRASGPWQRTFFDADEVDAARRELESETRSALTIEQVADRLGVGRNNVQSLTAAKLIPCRPSHSSGGNKTRYGSYSAPEVDAALDGFIRHVPVRPCPKDDAEAVRVIGAYHVLAGVGTLPELLVSIKSGALPAFRDPDSRDLTALWCERVVLVQYLGTLVPDGNLPRYTERDACMLLDCTLTSLRRWTAAGLLTSTVEEIPSGGQVTSYSGDDVRAFANRYVGLQTAAALLGVQYQSVQRGIRRGQYVGARVYGTPRYPDYLFDRRILEDIQANQITGDEAAELLGVGRKHFRRLVLSEQIAPVVKTMVRDRTFDRRDVLRLRVARKRPANSLSAPYVGAAEAARYIGVTERTFNRWVGRGRIREMSVGGVRRHLFALDDIVRLCTTQPTNEEMRCLDGGLVDSLTAVQLLKVNPNTFAGWVKRGWVVPVDGVGVAKRLYAREDVMALVGEVFAGGCKIR